MNILHPQLSKSIIFPKLSMGLHSFEAQVASVLVFYLIISNGITEWFVCNSVQI